MKPLLCKICHNRNEQTLKRSENDDKRKTFLLNDGLCIPTIGLGTVGIQVGKGVHEILSVFEAGDGFIGSKLPGLAHKYDKAFTLIQESLFRMGLDYFD